MKYLRRFRLLYLITGAIFLLICVQGGRAVTTIAEHAPIERETVFVIDAGHGGEDGGAVSCAGYAESGINLQIALRLNDLLHLLGRKTVMTRTTDCALSSGQSTVAARKTADLHRRAQIVTETEHAFLVSIHQNYFTQEKYSGAQMFYNDADGAREMALALQSAMVQTLNPGSNRKAKPVEKIYLLEAIDAPGVLVECGFLSNAAEEAKLRTEDYQKKLVCVLASVLTTQTS